jgi:tetratricopeptide (TPR) repeat protein
MRAIGWLPGAACLVTSLAGSAATPSDLAALEQAVAAQPENLRLAADYRQAIIRIADFDRSIRFFDQLAERSRGPNVHISLALAYVDKVPTAGDIRRLYLGRDAINALTKAIERQPSVLAYYMRGLINLYYNRFIFHRIPRGIADLEKARSMVTSATPDALVRRVYAALGDGHFKLGETSQAHDAWATGLARFPDDPTLRLRLAKQGRELYYLVTDALDPGTRVDTSLIGLLPAP